MGFVVDQSDFIVVVTADIFFVRNIFDYIKRYFKNKLHVAVVFLIVI